MSLILRQNPRPQGAHCPFPGCACIDGGGPDGGGGGLTSYSRKALTYDPEPAARYTPYSAQTLPPPVPPPSSGPMPPMRSAYAWDDRERDEVGSPHTSSASVSVGGSPARKHARSWDSVSLSSLHYHRTQSDIYPSNPSHPTIKSPISHPFLTAVIRHFRIPSPGDPRVTRLWFYYYFLLGAKRQKKNFFFYTIIESLFSEFWR